MQKARLREFGISRKSLCYRYLVYPPPIEAVRKAKALRAMEESLPEFKYSLLKCIGLAVNTYKGIQIFTNSNDRLSLPMKFFSTNYPI